VRQRRSWRAIPGFRKSRQSREATGIRDETGQWGVALVAHEPAEKSSLKPALVANRCIEGRESVRCASQRSKSGIPAYTYPMPESTAGQVNLELWLTKAAEFLAKRTKTKAKP
jgi:hypothetical protein